MLGCKLERAKCYRSLAASLNSYYKFNKQGLRVQPVPVNSKNPEVVNESYDQCSIPTPSKKDFAVRKYKQPTMSTVRQEIKK